MASVVFPSGTVEPRPTRFQVSLGSRAGTLAVVVAALLCWVGVGLGSLLGTCLVWFRHWGALSPGLALVDVHEVLVLVALLRRRWTPRWAVVTGVPLVAGVLWMMPWRAQLQPVNLWAPGYWGLPWVGLVMVSLPRRRYLGLIMWTFGLLTVADVVVQWAVGVPLTRTLLEPTPGIASPVALLVMFCDGLLQLAFRAEDAAEGRVAAEHARADEELRAAAGREVGRLVHDHVLQALHAVGSLAKGADRAMVVEECRVAVAALDDHLSQVPGDDDLAALLSDDPVLAAAGGRLVGHVPPLPSGVARTLAAAAHEALSNVARHSGADSCTVELRYVRGTWHCTVRDDGRGFDPKAVAATRLGLGRSIVERLEQAGGQAEVTSEPGRGTTIRLQWPATGPVESAPDAPTSEARRVLTRTAWPNLALAPVFTALLYPLCRPSWPTVVACGVLVAVGGWLVRRLADHPLTRWEVLIAMGVSFAVWTTNLVVAPDHLDNVLPLWLCWGCAALAHLVVLQVRWLRGLAALAGWALVMVVMLLVRYGGSVDWATLHPAVSVGVGEGLIALLAFHVGRSMVVRAERARLVERWERQEADRLRVQGQVDVFWTRSATARALDLLRTVAHGDRLDDAALAAEASRTEAALREELVLGSGNRTVLTRLAALRGAGWDVSSSLSPESGKDELELVAPLVDWLGAPGVPGQQVVLSAARGQATAVVLAPTDEQSQRWGSAAGANVVPGEFARLALRVRQDDPTDPAGAGVVGLPHGTS